MPRPPGHDEPTLRSLGPTVYGPSFLFAVGQGAVVPIVALAAKDLGASVALASLTVALRGIGTLVFDLPAGALVSRLGERRAMVVGTGILLASLVGCILATSVWVFAIGMFLMGCGWSMWLLARLTYVSDVMPLRLRGRALSTLGGVQRMGNFVGPFLGALALTLTDDDLDGAYFVHVALAVAGCALLLAVRDPHADRHDPHAGHGPVRFRSVAREHAPTFRTAGFGALCIGVLRASRQAVLPLWADHVGLDAASVGIIFGIAAGLDMLLFYPAGSVSDRFGRKFVAIPCLSILSLGFLLLPLTTSFATIVPVALLLGFGNGLGSGIVMTLGADFAPSRGRAEFLGVWRLVGDIGTAGGPLLAAGVTAALSLGPASLLTGLVGLTGAAVVLLRMPEPLREDSPPQTENSLAADEPAP
ncbi:MAG TPA: MFS transporter [Acidimicrobiales bacterium]|nr:MFS transporter [Acidimicrobiales bacterium]